MSSSMIFPALSIASIALASAAIVISQPAEGPAPTEMHAVEVTDTSHLEEQIASLTSEVLALQGQVEALQKSRDAAAPYGGVEGGDSLEALALTQEMPPALEGKIAEAIDLVIEQRQEEQREAKRRGARDGMASWIDSRLELLPNLYDRISDKMSLPAHTEQQVEDIIATTFETMAALTEQLYADPPPSDEEAREIMGEVKESVGGMVGQLDEILTAGELIQLGQATVDSEMPRVGYAIMEQGKEDYEEEAAGEGDTNAP